MLCGLLVSLVVAALFVSALLRIDLALPIAIATGNAVVLKPANVTPLTATRFCFLLLEAGVPPGFLHLLHGEGAELGPWLLEEQDVRFYTFTGSTAVGRAIQRAAGLRRTQLELGSISSTIVCEDTSIEWASPSGDYAGTLEVKPMLAGMCSVTVRLQTRDPVKAATADEAFDALVKKLQRRLTA